MPVAMALLRDVQNLCPKDVLNFILDLIKYNDNRKNKVKAVAVMVSVRGQLCSSVSTVYCLC